MSSTRLNETSPTQPRVILIVSPGMGRVPGGIAVFGRRLLEMAQAMGIPARLVRSDKGPLGVVRRLPHPIPEAAQVLRLLVVLADSCNEAALIHVQAASWWGFMPAIVSAWVGRRKNVPVAVTYHGGDAHRFLSSPLVVLVRRTLRSCDDLFVVSEHLATDFRERFPWLGETVITPAAADPVKFYPLDRQLARRRLSLLLPDDTKVVLYVGGLFAYKRVDLVIEALELIPEKQHAVLVIVGGGPERSRLEKLASKGIAGNRIRFVGVVPHEEVPMWLGASNAVVVPGMVEGAPTVIAEAFMAGRPVVTSNLPGAAFLLGDYARGWMVGNATPAAWAESLQDVLAREWDANELRKHAQAIADGLEERVAALYANPPSLRTG